MCSKLGRDSMPLSALTQTRVSVSYSIMCAQSWHLKYKLPLWPQVWRKLMRRWTTTTLWWRSSRSMNSMLPTTLRQLSRLCLLSISTWGRWEPPTILPREPSTLLKPSPEISTHSYSRFVIVTMPLWWTAIFGWKKYSVRGKISQHSDNCSHAQKDSLTCTM